MSHAALQVPSNCTTKDELVGLVKRDLDDVLKSVRKSARTGKLTRQQSTLFERQVRSLKTQIKEGETSESSDDDRDETKDAKTDANDAPARPPETTRGESMGAIFRRTARSARQSIVQKVTRRSSLDQQRCAALQIETELQRLMETLDVGLGDQGVEDAARPPSLSNVRVRPGLREDEYADAAKSLNGLSSSRSAVRARRRGTRKFATCSNPPSPRPSG